MRFLGGLLCLQVKHLLSDRMFSGLEGVLVRGWIIWAFVDIEWIGRDSIEIILRGIVIFLIKESFQIKKPFLFGSGFRKVLVNKKLDFLLKMIKKLSLITVFLAFEEIWPKFLQKILPIMRLLIEIFLQIT
jgi:hypothetical protein